MEEDLSVLEPIAVVDDLGNKNVRIDVNLNFKGLDRSVRGLTSY